LAGLKLDDRACERPPSGGTLRPKPSEKEKLMLIRKLSAAAGVLSLVGLAAPVGGAGADTTPATSAPTAAALPISFVPPKVGPISAAIGPTIIGGKVIDPGLNVSLPGISLPPITWTPPS
jgi:hypothetical protein